MSGISMAVAPRLDPDHRSEREPAAAMLGGVMGSLRVIELQLVAFIMVFSASGLVPIIDLAFPVATAVPPRHLPPRLPAAPRQARGHPLSRRLPRNLPRQQVNLFFFSCFCRLIISYLFRVSNYTLFHTLCIRSTHRLFQAYVVVGTTVGLFLPLAHVLGGFARGDDAAVRSATPHLFLLSCQILTENIVGSLGAFSPPVMEAEAGQLLGTGRGSAAHPSSPPPWLRSSGRGQRGQRGGSGAGVDGEIGGREKGEEKKKKRKKRKIKKTCGAHR
ncbi:hypothetical protein EJB05_36791, partial [Eragrostis curvula]